MRDALLLAIFPLLLYAIWKKPFIGMGLWIWTALLFPNGWVYGIASGIRFNFIFAGVALVSHLRSKQKQKFQPGVIGGLVILFLFWTFLSSQFTISYEDFVWEQWDKLAKITALFVFILVIVRKKLHIDFIMWCFLFSVGFFAVVEGLKYISSGGGHRVVGIGGHILADNNQLALAFAMTLPISFYLMVEYGKKHWIFKYGLLAVNTLLVTSIIGTNSRGGLIALLAVGGYLFIKSKRKFLFTFLVLVIGSLMIGLVSEEWFARMGTIDNAESDGSFMHRVVSWKLSFILAMQHPVFGGGFSALTYNPVWRELCQNFDMYPWFYTGSAFPNPNYALVAHSIYFQVLGDHGFVGLFIFLSMLLLAFFKAGSIASRNNKIKGPDWISHLATMLKLSIFTYCVGGAALNFAYFDMLYAIFALIIVLDNMVKAEVISAKKLALNTF